ncbi:TnsD family Tn7-like transposition protein [Amphritea sp.]|uniref:TnsD family Tn7-like transposition protein n=1 Tax=Amphritea sp. TaxID=1872502 RepID=UPI003A8E1F27
MLAFCPRIYEGETLYSWLARWGLRSGMPSNRVALKYLIGFENVQLTSSLPSYAMPLAEVAKLQVHKLVHNHTVIDYFQPFSDADVFRAVVEDMVKGDTQSVHTRLSIVASRVTDPPELRYCVICAANDYMKHGVTLWHLEHQLPGVTACACHGVLLIGVAKARYQLFLPPEFELTPSPFIASPAAVRLARLSSELFRLKEHIPSNARLVFAYQVRLVEKGYASINLTVRQESWRKELEQFWSSILDDPSIKSIFSLSKRVQFPACMVRRQVTQHHPLKHLLMIGALFETVSDFIDYCQCADSVLDNLAIRHADGLPKPREFKHWKESLELLRNGSSLRQVAVKMGCSVQLLKSLALRNGIDVNRRTQKLFATERRAIWRKLVVGMSAEAIAEDVGCSAGAVHHELRSYKELKDLRRKIRFYSKRSEHRGKLKKVMRRLALPSRGQVQSKARVSYTWLFKHDKQWLYQQLPKALKGGR